MLQSLTYTWALNQTRPIAQWKLSFLPSLTSVPPTTPPYPREELRWARGEAMSSKNPSVLLIISRTRSPPSCLSVDPFVNCAPHPI